MPENQIYFLRHKFTGIEESAALLRKKQLIAYHFSDEFHEKKEDYEILHEGYAGGFTQAFNAFKYMEEHGAIVVFEYENNNEFFIARVSSMQKVRPVHFELSEGKILVYKGLRYEEPKRFSYIDHPVLLAIRPPYSTICRPGPTFQTIINHLYLGSPVERTVRLLHPKTLEQLCETYLRSDFAMEDIRLQYAMLKIGKTFPIVDIFGRSVIGKKILVQVTHHDGEAALQKAKVLVELKKEVEDAIFILFSGSKKMEVAGLHFHFNIQEIFCAFQQSGIDWHTKMIDEMLGLFISG
jgi:hypothetical protein